MHLIFPHTSVSLYIFERNWRNLDNNYTRHESNSLLGVDGCHLEASGDEMAAQVSEASGSETDKSQLSKQDIRLLIRICTELVNFCARLTGKIDPAAAAMLAYVRDDIVSTSNEDLH
jgi:hypothetical protein